MLKYLLVCLLTFLICVTSLKAQHSVARLWNEVLLEGIRNDFARPTVHARNLFHISAAMYDCWAVFDPIAQPYFLGMDVHGVKIEFTGFPMPSDIEAAREEALSYACYRLINHRFEFSPGEDETLALADALMIELGYDTTLDSKLYSTGHPASLGNYLADQIIQFGFQDGSNELFDYDNFYYLPTNSPMIVANSGSQNINDPNRWQPLSFDVFIDQSGNVIPGHAPEFLSPEWGNTLPFSMTEENVTNYTRDGDDYKVYYDPGPPAYIDPSDNSVSQDYKWGHSMVAIWSAHLDPDDPVMWDISPGSIGNLDINNFPKTIPELQDFYQRLDGGDKSTGYATNPITAQPYVEQLVPRGDYGRVLAEFWADGPDSETPPGHWFTILNYVNDHEQLVKKFQGQGDIVDNLEWDIKSYFLLAGTMHDVAISSWSIKGYYDYIRPISAIRYMADQGQSSDPSKPSFSEAGIPLEDGYIELVDQGDVLAGENDENVGKIKLYAWKGPDYIQDPETDVAGAGWILAENWWPYQRPSFVTPPFAGYVSGHSTYSRAAAKVLTLLTGDEYFPGGMGEFPAPKNEFLVFEDGPSMDITLQWAKYYDASDQCSLSRIWGGIHPPVDDVPGRIIGDKIGDQAFEYAKRFFNGRIILNVEEEPNKVIRIYPNPIEKGAWLKIKLLRSIKPKSISIFTLDGKLVQQTKFALSEEVTSIKLREDLEGIYLMKIQSTDVTITKKIRVIR
ncbi:MAG: T9SS type A sorting domain-containing protein [Cyclobacteriaceae bacterium]